MVNRAQHLQPIALCSFSEDPDAGAAYVLGSRKDHGAAQYPAWWATGPHCWPVLCGGRPHPLRGSFQSLLIPFRLLTHIRQGRSWDTSMAPTAFTFANYAATQLVADEFVSVFLLL